MEELNVGQVIISKQGEDSENYRKFNEIVAKKNIKVKVVGTNSFNNTQTNEKLYSSKVQIEKDLYFDILWPNSDKLISENILNNNSIICKFNYKNFSMLFTGDIEKIAEEEILKQYKKEKSNQITENIFKSTVLKVAHHGSKSSSIQEFLDLVQPQIALIGVGQDNKFGHPNEEVVQRLENLGSKIYRTDQMGEITLNIDRKGKIKVKKFIENEKIVN
ncbi:MAG: hypothetical protein IKF38_02450 [Clostridia bacterium]|nr:hypothetical protein [Clostridia bacterium]